MTVTSGRLPDPRPDLALREGYHSPQVDVEVRLNTNESPLAPPEGWVAELQAAIGATDFHRYPDRRATALRGALADLHGVDVAQVFVANGSNEVLQSVLLGYGGPGRRALTFEPTYALHAHIAHLTGTEVVTAPRRDDFSVDPDAAADAAASLDAAVTFLCSPNNPTGNGEDRATVAAVLAAAPGLVVVDEAYGQFADWSALELVDDATPLVVTRTFSKTWSMAAMRLGYAVAAAPVVEVLERVALPYHLDAVKQQAGLLAVAHVAEMEARVGLIVRERERLVAALGRLPVTVWPSQANFVLFRPERRNGRDVWQGLVDRSVLVRDTSSWPGLGGCLRVTVGTPDENGRFLAALGEVLA
ncbi:MAG TPA: histidinol-phosphate transaminase [Acidimicrobiales bacterium]|nr:histidinol-phosphate transaminase [Acidimicrobiales bacterium]